MTGAVWTSQAVRARAIEQGLIDPSAQLSESELFSLILAPGFSTARKVTDVSGRGVGMDVVRRSVEALRGSIEIASQPGAGLAVTLRLPLTLAIIDGLLVRVGEAHFVLPLANSLECVELTRQDIQDAHGNHLASVRGETIPYIRLSEYFEMKAPRPEREQIMVVETEDGHYGLVVDEVLGNHQTVIKNLGRLYRDVPMVSGATILGNGTVALILDPHRLVQNVVHMSIPEQALRRPENPAQPGYAEPTDSHRPTHSRERKTASMLRNANGRNKKPRSPEPSGGGRAVLEYDAQGERVRGGSAERAADLEIERVSQEIARLVDASRQGRLEERGKLDQFHGVHREIVQGINDMLDAILVPIGEGNRVLAQVSNGKIDELISQTYKGDHEKMKQAVNNVATVLQGLQREMARLTEASREGRLTERGKPDGFKGAYADIVQGVNAMLDAILLPIGEGNRILAQISGGKIDELIAHTYKGDHEKMKQAVNNVGLVIQSLQKELIRLTDASKDGQLSERGKPEQFQGAYADIVQGVNAMLDAILLPIGEGNRILAQISSGKIDELIAHTYKGDHEKMKQAVNNVGTVIQSLQKELNRLTDASKDGQLSERGKPEQFQGAYADDRARA